ncbi:MAG: FAD-binding protein [Chlorobi bacterium]|nr:FAD-binding protein [Chlorobiota bacterium]
MQKEVTLRLSPYEAYHSENYNQIISKQLKIKSSDINKVAVLSKSIDARSKEVKVVVKANVFINENPETKNDFEFNIKNVSAKPEIIIIGAGPAGLFAALRLIELGLKPVIIERGKNVKERRKDIAAINKEHIVDSDSNYCFGEGGAGTFSDGKLYTRSKKRGSVKRILALLEFFGADKNILIDAHPHIGTNKLPGIIVNIREAILEAGGEILYSSKLTDFIIENDVVKGVKINNNVKIYGKAVILATGHSASDIYYLLHKKNIAIELKPFAIGVRVEHPQNLIDSIQYHCEVRSEYLPAASYSLVNQINGRGVYSFCMCPGGFIVPSATHHEEIVVNGMSPSSRNSKFANSGMVVELREEDFAKESENGPLSGLAFREKIEKMAWLNSGSGQTAPAQRIVDFVDGKLSADLPETSYQPGIVSSPLHFWLPEIIGTRLRQALKLFNNKMRGYLTNEAVMLGVESRTSSPVRIPRDKESLEHVQIKGLYPAGEGAGYAGGIVSSAIDGERCAEKVAEKIKK